MDTIRSMSHDLWPPPSFLGTFMASMHVRMLALCSDTSLNDSEYVMALNILQFFISNEDTILIQFIEKDPKSWDAFRPSSKDVVLIYCPESNFVSSQTIPDWALRTNVMWLVPDMAIEDLPKNLRLDSLFFTFSKRHSAKLKITEAFRIKRGPAIKQIFATWNMSSNQLDIPDRVIWNRRKDLYGTELANAVLEWKPFFILGSNGTLDTVSGIMVDLLTDLQGSLNFTVKNYFPEDGQWGFMDHMNGSEIVMTGLSRELQLGRADICTAGQNIVLSRQATTDMVSVISDYSTLIMRRSLAIGGAKINTMAYLLIFGHLTWTSLALISLAIIAAFAMTRHEFGSAFSPYSFIEGVQLSFLTLLQLTMSVISEAISSKIVQFSASIMGFVIYTYFCCDLTAKITHKAQTVIMQNFEGVLSSEYDLRIVQGSSIHGWFRDAPKSSAMGRLYQLMVENDKLFFDNIAQAVEILEMSDSSVSYGSYLAYQSMDWALPIRSFQPKTSSHVGWSFQLHSEFYGLFSFHLTRLHEFGVIDQIMEVWMRRRRPREEMEHRIFVEEATPLGYDNLLFPSLVLSLGTLMSFVIAVLEKTKRRQNS